MGIFILVETSIKIPIFNIIKSPKSLKPFTYRTLRRLGMFFAFRELYKFNIHQILLAMKHLRLILLGVFTLLLATGNAQIKIEKRKHLKGYNVDVQQHVKNPSDFKIADGERVGVAEVAKQEEKQLRSEEPVTVIRPIAESSFFPENPATVATEPTKDFVAAKSAKGKGGIENSSFLRKGAGLILAKKINSLHKKLSAVAPAAVTAGPEEVFAYIGFACGILAILGLAAGGLFFFFVPGIIFSILGYNSAAGNFAKIGLILSLVALLLFLIFLLFVASYYAWN